MASNKVTAAVTPATTTRVPMRTAKGTSTMPQVGFGLWTSKSDALCAPLYAAVVHGGVRHVDSAKIYENEPAVGNVLAKIFAETNLKREDLFITSKLWNTDHSCVEAACRQTLKDLKLDQLDLYLMHFPCAGNTGPTVDPPLDKTWADMERLVDLGLTKAIGVANFSAIKLDRLRATARLPISVNQVECHPHWRQEKLVSFCNDAHITFCAYSALGSLNSFGMEGVHDVDTSRLVDDPVVQRVAKEARRTPQQVLIRWALQARPHAALLFQSTSPEHVVQDLDVFSWQLSEAHMQDLSSLRRARLDAGRDKKLKLHKLLNHEGPYKSVLDLWDDDVCEKE